MSKFTPGPWVPFNRGIGWEVHNEDGWCINDGHRETFTEADARLIAAAPDGYGCATQAYLFLLVNVGHDHQARATLECQALLASLRSFIAQVEGRDDEEVQDEYEGKAGLARINGDA